MIPPITSAQEQVRELQNMVGWNNPFNMRQVTLINMASSHSSMRNGNKLNIPYLKKTYSITSPTKSLDILRRNLQSAINKDIENVIKKYLEKFFQPAIVNIKNNLGKDSINEEHIKEACRKMLEDAKSMYKSDSSRDSSPYEYSDSDVSLMEGRIGRNSPFSSGKRKGSDTDSEPNKTHKKARVRSTQDYNLHKLPVKREAPKWDSERINQSTLFIMGAKANKVLGYGQTRGRLYVRHPELVRYSGDQEDKEWLSSKNLMPPSGGKAYLMILNDIKELTESEDYRNNPNLQLGELKGFEVPPFLVSKIRNFMESVRTDRKMELFDLRSQSLTPPILLLDSPVTSSDVMPLESHSGGSASSKHSDFVHIPETSPSSNNSILSTNVNHSPLSTTSNMLLTVSNPENCQEVPVMMLKTTTSHNGTQLTNILNQHFDTNESFR